MGIISPCPPDGFAIICHRLLPIASQMLPRGAPMKLTQSTIAKLTLSGGKADEIFFDDELPRFGVRVAEGGSRKYIVQYRQGGSARRYTIGPTATMTLDEARKRARKVLVAVDDGRNPGVEKETARAASGLIFAAVATDFLG